MHTVEIGEYKLELSDTHIRYGGYEIPLDRIRGLNVIRKNNTTDIVELFLPTPINLVVKLLARLVGISFKQRSVASSRFISVRGDSATLRIDCSWAFAIVEELDAVFDSAFDLIWQAGGKRLTAGLIFDLERGQTVTIGDISVCREGVWLYGKRSIMFWTDKPALVPWGNIEIADDEAGPCIRSIIDPSRSGVLAINNVENATVLEAAIRHLLQDNNWKKLGGPVAAPPSLN